MNKTCTVLFRFLDATRLKLLLKPTLKPGSFLALHRLPYLQVPPGSWTTKSSDHLIGQSCFSTTYSFCKSKAELESRFV